MWLILVLLYLYVLKIWRFGLEGLEEFHDITNTISNSYKTFVQ